MVTVTLEEAGYAVIEACDGVDALTKLKKNKVDMIITDINMPNMDGLELIRQTRALPEYKFIPIVVMTIEFDISKKRAGRAAGATGWLVKPFSPPQLTGVVRKVLR
jgi:two-component system chemotaxis response regulator CheY